MPGRKPKPAQLKVIQGTRRKDRENPHAPKAEALNRIPAPPEFLGESGRTKWLELATLLVQRKILTDMDLHNLEGFCVAYENWRTAQQDLRLNGLVMEGAMGGPVKNPAATVLKEASNDLRAYGSNLGLDPASRSRIIVGEGKGQQDNPFADL